MPRQGSVSMQTALRHMAHTMHVLACAFPDMLASSSPWMDSEFLAAHVPALWWSPHSNGWPSISKHVQDLANTLCFPHQRTGKCRFVIFRLFFIRRMLQDYIMQGWWFPLVNHLVILWSMHRCSRLCNRILMALSIAQCSSRCTFQLRMKNPN